eukprot:1181538-Prorocentrum_minimum.AAC.7
MCCSKRYVNAATPRVVLINATISGHLLWSRVCAYLERVDEGHPCEVPEGEHVAEAVGGGTRSPTTSAPPPAVERALLLDDVIAQTGRCCRTHWTLLSHRLDVVVAQTGRCYRTDWTLLSHRLDAVIAQTGRCCRTDWTLLSHRLDVVIAQTGRCCRTDWTLSLHRLDVVVAQTGRCCHTDWTLLSHRLDVVVAQAGLTKLIRVALLDEAAVAPPGRSKPPTRGFSSRPMKKAYTATPLLPPGPVAFPGLSRLGQLLDILPSGKSAKPAFNTALRHDDLVGLPNPAGSGYRTTHYTLRHRDMTGQEAREWACGEDVLWYAYASCGELVSCGEK